MLRVEGPKPCSSWVTQGTFPLQNFPLYYALSPTVHLNGSNGTAYTRPCMVQNSNAWNKIFRVDPPCILGVHNSVNLLNVKYDH